MKRTTILFIAIVNSCLCILAALFAVGVLSGCSDSPGDSSVETSVDPEVYVHFMYVDGKRVHIDGRDDKQIENMISDFDIDAVVPVVVSTTDYGKLSDAVGDRALTMEALGVEGKIDASDIAFIRECVKNGRLRAVDLSYASVKDNRIPDEAFFETYGDGQVIIPLISIIMPESITEIGEYAFAGGILKTVNIPGSLRKLGRSSFSWNTHLTGDIVIPDRVDKIPQKCFIGTEKISKIIIPESVTVIEEYAFAHTGAKTVVMKNGLEVIGRYAFVQSAMEELVLPETVRKLGIGSCLGLESLKAVYSLNPEPPYAANPGEYYDGLADNHKYYPEVFGDKEISDTPKGIPVYVPVGSKEKYMKAKGWNWFTNYIETDNMPAI